MASTRQNKVARLLQKELGDYFQRNGNGITGGKMVTVTVVRISPDLGVARVYISIFPAGDAKKALGAINERNPSIRNEIGKKVKHQLRRIPEISFFLDDSLDYIERIDNLLSE
jgi:ribosome-binding factor A